jgi:hypothetical protein
LSGKALATTGEEGLGARQGRPRVQHATPSDEPSIEVDSMREEHSFRLVLEGPPLNTKITGKLFDAGCGDALVGEDQGVKVAEFNRVAMTFERAVLSAIENIESAQTALTVVRVEPDDLVTASGIAERTGRSRQSIAQLIAGERRSGDFPTPISTTDGKRKIWRWTDVQAWFAKHNDEALPDGRRAHFIAAINGALEVRRHSDGYRHDGGSPTVVREIQTIAQAAHRWGEPGDGTARVAAARQVVAGAQAAVRSVQAECAASLASRVRRAQSHLVFLTTLVVADLYPTVEMANPSIAGWLKDATDAYSQSVQVRLAGDFTGAVLHDQLVADNAMRIIKVAKRPAKRLPLNLGLAGIRKGQRPGPDAELSTFRAHGPSGMGKLGGLHDVYSILVHGDQGSARDEHALQKVAGLMLDYDASESIRWVPERPFGQPHFAPESWIDKAPSTLDFCPDGEVYWCEHRSPSADAPFEPRKFALVRQPSEVGALEDSMLLLLMSSWTLASTVGLLAGQYLPSQVQSIEDVLERIEQDLAARSI